MLQKTIPDHSNLRLDHNTLQMKSYLLRRDQIHSLQNLSFLAVGVQDNSIRVALKTRTQVLELGRLGEIEVFSDLVMSKIQKLH